MVRQAHHEGFIGELAMRGLIDEFTVKASS
jgi:hypothetical protein